MSRSGEVDHAAGAQHPEVDDGSKKDAPGYQPGASDTGGLVSNAAWEAYALFAVRTARGIPLSRDPVAEGLAWTLALRRGVRLRGGRQKPRRIY